MKNFRARRTLIGFLLLGLAWAGFTWLASSSPEEKPVGRALEPRERNKPSATRPIRAPRSLQGLTLDNQPDISADARTPNVRRDSIVRMGVGEVQEMNQMNSAVFDDAVKQWNAQPRVKALVAEWKELEEAWKTRDDEAKAADVPRMEAMWKEAIGLLRKEVEKSAREAAGGVK